MKVIKDFKDYLDYIEKLAKTLPPEKKVELENVLSVMLTLLVSLKKSSHLGHVSIDWLAGGRKEDN